MTYLDFDATVDQLAGEILSLSDRGRSAIFGACGEAMLVLLGEVERRTFRRWTFPEARPALDAVLKFVTGAPRSAGHAELRKSLLRSVPHGNDLDSPWSTYAQDAIICIDAALVASSPSSYEEFRSNWIQFALEPLVVSLSARDYDVDVDPTGECPLQAELDTAVDFLHNASMSLSGMDLLEESMYRVLIREARVVVPSFN